ncbi:MAG: hypothetical protein RL420_974 [Pseudomonadota bacterium]
MQLITTMLHVTRRGFPMASQTSNRVQKHRDGLRAQGLRPVQIWVPDTRREGFESLCAKQAQLVANLEMDDTDLARDLNLAFRDIDGWQ